jgi:hypothetical protein
MVATVLSTTISEWNPPSEKGGRRLGGHHAPMSGTSGVAANVSAAILLRPDATQVAFALVRPWRAVCRPAALSVPPGLDSLMTGFAVPPGVLAPDCIRPSRGTHARDRPDFALSRSGFDRMRPGSPSVASHCVAWHLVAAAQSCPDASCRVHELTAEQTVRRNVVRYVVRHQAQQGNPRCATKPRAARSGAAPPSTSPCTASRCHAARIAVMISSYSGCDQRMQERKFDILAAYHAREDRLVEASTRSTMATTARRRSWPMRRGFTHTACPSWSGNQSEFQRKTRSLPDQVRAAC